MLAFNAAMSHRFVEGKKQEILFFISSSLLISLLIGYLIYSLWKSNFNFDRIDWFECFTIIAGFDPIYYAISRAFRFGYAIGKREGINKARKAKRK
jgi:hypothetical protein